MKNRNLLILGLGILLSSCTGNNTSTTPMTLEKALLELGNNFHTVYQDKNGSYDYYQQDNFSYDTYNNLGLLTMKNGGCYEFTIADDNVICSLPSTNDNKYYDNYISKIDLSIDDFEEVVKLDVQYIDNWSIWMDIYLLFRTVGVVFDRKGAK